MSLDGAILVRKDERDRIEKSLGKTCSVMAAAIVHVFVAGQRDRALGRCAADSGGG